MENKFYIENRKALCDSLEEGSLALFFGGKSVRKSADAFYPFYANRNFVYMTGLEKADFILLIEKSCGVKETIFILPKDPMLKRWNGRRLSPQEVTAISGIENIKHTDEFTAYFHSAAMSGCFDKIGLDLYKYGKCDINAAAHDFAVELPYSYPFLKIINMLPQLKKQRTIKKDCEIAALKKAIEITKDGILSMMKAAKPGMYEYQLKAEFDRALANQGVLDAGFQSIISAGANNFCIHYDEYSGIINHGDMILNDVGAVWDHLICDVSRGWPVDGKFSEKQRLLYQCAYNTSEYMFGLLKPGIPMADVDRYAREHSFKQLNALGIVDRYENVGKLIWHGGAHHIGFDVHDVVDMTMELTPGMVFCVDIGIYCEEWGIGFRLEDNCLITESGCKNLTSGIPRSVREIEDAMK